MRRSMSGVLALVRPAWGACVVGALAGAGCIERTMTVTSDPPGALIYVNDQEIGRTPLTRDFLSYGVLEVFVRKDGYQTIKVAQPFHAPWFDRAPIDLLAELMPVHVRAHKELHYVLQPATNETVDPADLLRRGAEMQGDLESSKFTRTPVKRPAPPADQPLNSVPNAVPKGTPDRPPVLPESQPATAPTVQPSGR